MMEVRIDGIVFVPRGEKFITDEAMEILRFVSGRLWTEVYYDAYSDATLEFAKPLEEKMWRLNEIIGFKK